jgi:signal transduction histidine kinase
MIRPFPKDADNYTLYGIIFGLCFPLFATILRGITCDGACSLAKFASLQISDPLLWIIDTAPVFLGLFARIGGIQKDKVTFYAKNLEVLVDQRTNQLACANKEIADIMRNVPIALFTINNDRLINKGCSEYLNQFLCKNSEKPCMYPDAFSIAGKERDEYMEWHDFLFSDSSPGWDVLKDLCGLHEIVLEKDGVPMILEVTYHPIIENSSLGRLMIIMHDVTQQRALAKKVEQEKKGREEDIEQIAEILKLDSETFEQFVFESKKIISGALKEIDSLKTDRFPEESINDLFRKMHTIKGNAKTFRFNQLGSLAHHVEDIFSDIRDNKKVLTEELHLNIVREVTLVEEKLNSIILLSKNVGSGQDTGKVRDDNREVFIRVKLQKILHLCSLSQVLSESNPVSDLKQKELAEEIREAVGNLRKCPVERLFQRFPKMVKDLGIALGKQIDVVVSGGDLEINLDILDTVGNALVHLVRNAVDHGVEKAAVRISAGKKETALITIKASFGQGNIIFSVEDDGAGINAEAVRTKALEKGLLNEEEVASLTSDDIYRLIMQPGFSTSETVSDISGRGVGMDAVAASVAALEGSLSIQSEAGKGTRFILTIPERKKRNNDLSLDFSGDAAILRIHCMFEGGFLDRLRNLVDPLLKGNAKRFYFDVASVPILTSEFLGFLVTTHLSLKEIGKQLFLVTKSEVHLDILKSTLLDGLVTVIDSF